VFCTPVPLNSSATPVLLPAIQKSPPGEKAMPQALCNAGTVKSATFGRLESSSVSTKASGLLPAASAGTVPARAAVKTEVASSARVRRPMSNSFLCLAKAEVLTENPVDVERVVSRQDPVAEKIYFHFRGYGRIVSQNDHSIHKDVTGMPSAETTPN
jgi:hypothetical protein